LLICILLTESNPQYLLIRVDSNSPTLSAVYCGCTLDCFLSYGLHTFVCDWRMEMFDQFVRNVTACLFTNNFRLSFVKATSIMWTSWPADGSWDVFFVGALCFFLFKFVAIISLWSFL
jgi:hypothetical protein